MSKIPTAVLKQEQAADEALERDAPNFDPDSVGVEDGAGTPVIAVRQEIPAPPFGQPGLRLGQEAQQPPQDAQRQDGQDAQGDGGQKPEGQKSPEELAQEIKLERERNACVLGRINSVIKPLDEESKRLRKRVEELEKELSAKTQNDAPDVKKLRESIPHEIPVDDNELEMIARIVRQTVSEELKDKLPGATKSLRDEIEATSREHSMKAFVESVEQTYPGFVELDARNDKSWVAFLNTPVKGTGGRVTYGQSAEAAMNAMDIKGLSEIVDEFSRQSGIAFGSTKNGMDSRVSSQVRARQTGAVRQQNRGKPVFTQSQVARFTKDFASKAIYRELPPEAVDELRRDIEEAEEDGRVVPG